MADRRVVMTGVGTANPLGMSVPEFWDALIAGQSGIRPIARLDTSDFPSKIGGEVLPLDDVQPEVVDPREWKRMDRFTQLAVHSAIEAVNDAGLDFEKEDRARCAAIVGSGIGGLLEIEQQHEKLLSKGPSRVSPFVVPKMMINAAPGNIAILYGLQGTNFSIVTACASAAHSIGEAFRVLQRGDADIVITGGSEASVTKIGLAGFCALRGLSTRNDDPEHASRPWDRDRDGFLLSEGAGILILEELEHARKRGADIYAELVGYGASCDGGHITAPDPEGKGAAMAMKQCVDDAGVALDAIPYINAHGTSTELGDIAETRAIKRCFGDHATGGLAVSSTKSSTGHLLGASGGVELIVCGLAIRNGILPATLNLENPGEGCDLDYVPLQPREQKIDLALSNSFGFGGHNGCLLLKRFDG